MPRTQTVQQPRVPGLVDTRYDVIVAGRKIGEVIKNKHGVWWGHFDPGYTVANRDYIFRERLAYSVRPSRRKTDVVAAVVAGRVGEYAAEIQAEIAQRDAARRATAMGRWAA